METVTLSVPEIVCDACAQSIRGALERLPGLGPVDVDVATKRVDVAFDPGRTDAAAIRAGIEQAGFDVE